MEDIWKRVFLSGAKWEVMNLIYQTNWNFSNLEKAVKDLSFREDGKNVYIFGSTEHQLSFGEGFVYIPVMVAHVVSPCPPSDMVGIYSMDFGDRDLGTYLDEIIPMKQMNLEWAPYIPEEHRIWESEDNLEPRIFLLSCTLKRGDMDTSTLEQVKKYKDCLPYDLSTCLDFVYPPEAPTVCCFFDWKKDVLEAFVTEKVKEATKCREERKAIEDALSEETKAANKIMRCYKFYPVPTPYTLMYPSVLA